MQVVPHLLSHDHVIHVLTHLVPQNLLVLPLQLTVSYLQRPLPKIAVNAVDILNTDLLLLVPRNLHLPTPMQRPTRVHL